MNQTPDLDAREIRRGDLFWIVSDEPDGIAHPHVVVQDDVFNRSRVHSVIVCALSSNPKRANEPGNVVLEPGEGNLPRPSVVIVSQVSAVDRATLGERIGALSTERVQQVIDGLRFQQASFFTR
jgi:mRNA interferase MazF